jgi:hypothetical protein
MATLFNPLVRPGVTTADLDEIALRRTAEMEWS